jgi:hypothetical protein
MTAMKGKPDISHFLDGHAENKEIRPQSDPAPSPVPAEAPEPAPTADVPLKLVAIRLPKDLIDALDDEIYLRRRRTGVRITKQDLIEQAMRAGMRALKIKIGA